MSNPIYDQLSAERLVDVPEAEAELPSRTAGEQDHTDPWVYAGDIAEAPESS